MTRKIHRLPRGYFADAPLSTPAGSDAAQETRPLVDAGGVTIFGAARSARAVGQQPIGTATNATPSLAPTLSSVSHGAGFWVTAGVGLSSAPAYLDDVDRDRLRWLRRIFKAA